MVVFGISGLAAVWLIVLCARRVPTRRGDKAAGTLPVRVAQHRFQSPRRSAIAVPLIVLGVCFVWISGDLGYSLFVAHRLAQREASIDRDRDGVEAGCRSYTVGSGDTALLLIHGINSSPACFHRMAPVLADAGFTCRVMRLPGFAEPIDRYAAATREDWLAAVRREVESLRRDHDHVALIGHSLGGAVALATALDAPQSIDALILLAPAIEVSNRRSPLLSPRVWHQFGRQALWFTTVTYSPFEGACHDPEGEQYPGYTRFTPVAVADQTFQLIDSNRGRARDLRGPLLLILTKDDLVVDWQASQRLYDQAGSAPKELCFLENSGHAIPVDYGWQPTTQRIATFLRDLPEPANDLRRRR
jgi:carboxylesterase